LVLLPEQEGFEVEAYKERFYELYQFLAGYFHQDWLHVYDWEDSAPGYEAIVRHFKALNAGAVGPVAHELEELLKQKLSDDELEEVVAYDLGSAYYPLGSGQSYRQWLEAVLVILKEPQDKARAMQVIG
jgi:hypothetical protein